MLTCMRSEDNMSLQDAMSQLHAHISALEERFLVIRAKVWAQHQHQHRKQSWLPAETFEASRALLAYVDGIGNWVRANDAWSFESQRYFGHKGLEIQASRVVELRPKRGAK